MSLQHPLDFRCTMLAETWEVVIWLLLVGITQVPCLLVGILHLLVGMSKRVLKNGVGKE